MDAGIAEKGINQPGTLNQKVDPLQTDPRINALLTDTDIAGIERKHFVPNVGSHFDDEKIHTVQALLQLGIEKRGNLDGDDRKLLMNLGVPESVFAEDCRYLFILTAGVKWTYITF